MKSTLTFLIFLTFAYSLAQNTVTDIDGNTYKTVIIGQQEWMAEELKTTKFTDGTPIQEYKYFDESEWDSYKDYIDWQIQNNIKEIPNYRKEGQTYSYNEVAINSGKKLCPKGWRIPTKEDWGLLFETLGGRDIAGLSLRSTSAWPEGSNGTNESGFNAIPTNADFQDFCPRPNAVWWCDSGCKTIFLCSETGYGNEKNNIKKVLISFYGDGAMYDYACVRCVKE